MSTAPDSVSWNALRLRPDRQDARTTRRDVFEVANNREFCAKLIVFACPVS